MTSVDTTNNCYFEKYCSDEKVSLHKLRTALYLCNKCGSY